MEHILSLIRSHTHTSWVILIYFDKISKQKCIWDICSRARFRIEKRLALDQVKMDSKQERMWEKSCKTPKTGEILVHHFRASLKKANRR